MEKGNSAKYISVLVDKERVLLERRVPIVDIKPIYNKTIGIAATSKAILLSL